MKPYIIGLTGLAGSGKDTAAAFLAEALQARGRRVEIMAFAEPIRWMLQALRVPTQYMTERSLKELDVPGFDASYRHMAQTLGTEWGRQCMGGGFWVKHLEHRIDLLCEDARRLDFVIVSDVRFPNEMNWVKAKKGSSVAVVRPCAEPVREHESERHQLQPDHLLRNDADLQALRGLCGHLSNVLLAESALEI